MRIVNRKNRANFKFMHMLCARMIVRQAKKLPQTGCPLFRRLLPYPLAACFRVLIRIGVHGIGRMDGAEGIVHFFVWLILGDTSNMRSSEPGVRRLLPALETYMVLHWLILPENKMQTERVMGGPHLAFEM